MLVKIIEKMTPRKDWRYHRRSMDINSEFKRFKDSARLNFTTLMISGFGLVSALSWNDAIKSAITELFPGDTYIYKFYVALLVTLISVVVIYLISKFKTQ